MIQTVQSFIEYFESIRRRTMNLLRALPPEQMDWAPRVGELTCGDIVRHLAASEQMFVGVVTEGRWRYAGHDRNLAATYATAIAHLEATHADALNALRAVNDAQLYEPRPALKGQPVKLWRWLMALVEHEVHHRSQLAAYLALMGAQPPQVFGLTIEEIIAQATN